MLTAAVAFALTAAGLAVAGLRAHRRRFRSATRWFAVALLPAGLYLTGLFPLARTIAHALGDWAAGVVLDPRVWTGIVLLAVSAGLLLTTRWVGRRSVSESESRPAAAGPAPARPAVPGTPARPPAGAGATGAPDAAGPGRPAKGGKRDDGLGGDFADIEEILRRRGI
ncbi:hypothetical protein OH807_10050 [Kitasatospora sp. NBC_01560]|uniref:hypothetical protein n=1 Tax=Kitasatospora sp. NBC_01560 TaxID=2975965 RepID=UPI00386B6A63